MANRPVFCAVGAYPYAKVENVYFQFYSGFSVAQKRRSIQSLHEAFLGMHPERRVLEVSSRSEVELGVELSAFNLMIRTKIPGLEEFSVESAFQASKVFESGGPYTDLLFKSSREAKKDPRIRNGGNLVRFEYFHKSYPLEPKDYFYCWLYINALAQNEEKAEAGMQYDSFTDIEFNPKKQFNCQAKALAVYAGLVTAGKLEEALSSHEEFLSIVYGIPAKKPEQQEYRQMELKNFLDMPGD